ncbi:MAG: MarR family transcriptional regulator [Nocardioides sp.]
MDRSSDEFEDELIALYRQVSAVHARAGGHAELERSAYGILSLLDREGPVRLGHIAATFRLDPSTITRQVQAVVRQGLAVKSVDPDDRRATILALTEAGRQAVVHARRGRSEAFEAIVEDWTREERSRFVAGMRRLNACIDVWLDDRDRQPPLDPHPPERST